MPVSLSESLPLLLQIFASLSAGAIMGRNLVRQCLAWIIGTLSCGIPWLLPEESTVMRAVVVTFDLVLMMRLLDLATDRREWSIGRRIWMAIGFVDVRKVERVAPRVSLGVLSQWIAFTLGMVGFYLAATRFDLFQGRLGFPLQRWFFGAGMIYCLVETANTSLRFVYRLVGVELPVLHRHPILSKSLAEFWGERWNRVVHEWLRAHFFWPLARRRKSSWGIFAAFAASTFIHFWFVFVSLNLEMALAMGSFFVLQSILVSIEPLLPWGRSNRWGRPWAVLAVLLPSPLFVEGALRILEGAF